MPPTLTSDEHPECSALYAELRKAARAIHRLRRPESFDPTDLANEAFLRIADRRMTTKEHSGLVATVIENLVFDQYRRRRPRPANCSEILASTDDGSSVERTDSALDTSAALDLLREVSPRQARVVEMMDFEGYDREEIAAKLGIAVRTVSRDLKIGRTWLKQRIEPMAT